MDTPLDGGGEQEKKAAKSSKKRKSKAAAIAAPVDLQLVPHAANYVAVPFASLTVEEIYKVFILLVERIVFKNERFVEQATEPNMDAAKQVLDLLGTPVTNVDEKVLRLVKKIMNARNTGHQIVELDDFCSTIMEVSSELGKLEVSSLSTCHIHVFFTTKLYSSVRVGIFLRVIRLGDRNRERKTQEASASHSSAQEPCAGGSVQGARSVWSFPSVGSCHRVV